MLKDSKSAAVNVDYSFLAVSANACASSYLPPIGITFVDGTLGRGDLKASLL
jgi:hypothetical protein